MTPFTKFRFQQTTYTMIWPILRYGYGYNNKAKTAIRRRERKRQTDRTKSDGGAVNSWKGKH